MIKRILRLDSFISLIETARTSGHMRDMQALKEIMAYMNSLNERLESPKATWSEFAAFWPPRYVQALLDREAVVFFGSGLSMPCGIPTWSRLLTENLGLDRAFTEDEDLSSDPLTMAELASQHLGIEKLQDVLRRIMNRPKEYSLSHAALCALRCPAYITTNYDCLFEKAWKDVNPSIELVEATNDADLSTTAYKNAIKGNGAVLYKIHGCSSRADEHMILTRRDYRFHYRVNNELFDSVRGMLQTRHTLFLGFGHKDPEVTRLVDDAIHKYEKDLDPKEPPERRPQFYSLQFDMKEHTPEVFAARGIVALNPPSVVTEGDDVRTLALGISLADLLAAKQHNLHAKESLDNHLNGAMKEIAIPLLEGLDILSDKHDQLVELLNRPTKPGSLDHICAELKTLASQGLYLLEEHGEVHGFSVPDGLNRNKRAFDRPLNNRPYFQQAKLFREPFISNSAKSLLNEQATFFLCLPVIENERMIGLLFSATQIGQWEVPLAVARNIWSKGLSLLLVDGNGICLIPPMNEFPIRNAPKSLPKESKRANMGYSFKSLLVLSRRDVLVSHIGKNVVPVAQDDDVLRLSEDLRQYTIVGRVPRSAWKLGISVPVHRDTVVA